MKILVSNSFTSINEEEIWTRRKTVEIPSLATLVETAKSQKNGFYQSVHLISNDKSVYPYLFIDIDHRDLTVARTYAVDLYTKFLNSFGKSLSESIELFFSGSKGFHILIDARLAFDGEVPSYSVFGPDIQRKFVNRIVIDHLGMGRDLIDMSIYSKNRMIRSTNSLNLKSNLYKIQISSTEIETLSIEELKNLARSPRHLQTTKMDICYTRFINTPEISPRLNDLVNPGSELNTPLGKPGKRNKDKTKGKEYHTKSKTEEKRRPAIAEYSSDKILTKCRAARLLRRGVLRDGIASHQNRVALARILARSDSQASQLHQIFHRLDGYNETVTNENAKGLFQSPISCESLLDTGICLEACTRYRTKSGVPSFGPSFFGNKIDGKWWARTQPHHITQTAFRLIEYHTETSDFFDWPNAAQFSKRASVYSFAVSDYLRRQEFPEGENYLVNVKKPNNNVRQLVHVHFELELISSIFVEDIIESNLRYKKQEGIARNVRSFGYLEKDESRASLISPWRAEHGAYTQELRVSSNDEAFPIVFSTDIKDFYPSIGMDRALTLANKSLNDPRSIAVLRSLLTALYVDPNQQSVRFSSSGLPQGPIVSHVIAARLLLEIDDLIARSFSPEELKLVRYCDDFIFFLKDESTYEKLADKVIKEIELKFEVTFHTDFSGGKCYKSDRVNYVEERLQSDLYKYQVRFETELSQEDPESKKELLELLVNIFGSTFEKIFSVNPSGNIKMLEQQLTSIRWKVPRLIEDDPILHESIERLALCLESFLSNSNISYKLQTNLIMLYLTIIENVPSQSSRLAKRFCDVAMEKAGNLAFIENTLLMLQKELFLRASPQIRQVSQQLIHAALKMPIRFTPFQLKLIDQLQRLLLLEGSSSFDVKLWGTGNKVSFPNLASRIEGLLNVIQTPDLLEQLLQYAGPEVEFYDRLIGSLIDDEVVRSEQHYELYRISIEFHLVRTRQSLVGAMDAGLRLGHLPESISLPYLKEVNAVKKDAQLLLEIQGDKISVHSNLNGSAIYRIDNCLFMHEQISYINHTNYEKKEMVRIISLINEIEVLGSINFGDNIESSVLTIVYQLPSKPSHTLEAYLSSRVRVEDILAVEAQFFLKLSEKYDDAPRLILNARDLGIGAGGTNKVLILTNLSKVIHAYLSGHFIDVRGREIKAPIRKSVLLPGMRVVEAVFRHHKHKAEVEKLLGKCGISTIGMINPDRKSSSFYTNPKRLTDILSSIDRYRSKLSKADELHLDRVRYSTYRLFNILRTMGESFRFRNQTSTSNSTFSKIFEIVSTLLSDVSIIDSSSNQVSAEELVRSNKLLKVEYIKKSRSLDQLIGAALLHVYISFSKRVHKGFDPTVIIIGITGAVVYHHALYELTLRFGIASNENKGYLDLLERFRAEIKVAMSRSYLVPVEMNAEPFELICNAYIPRLLSDVSRSPAVRGVQFTRLRDGLEFFPPLPPAEERLQYSSEFHKTEVTFRTYPNGLVGLASLVSEKIGSYIGYGFSGQHSVSLHKSFSGLQSWTIDSDVTISNVGVVTTGLNGQFILNAPSRRHFFFPSGFPRSRIAHTHYVFAIFALIAIALVYLLIPQIFEYFYLLLKRSSTL